MSKDKWNECWDCGYTQDDIYTSKEKSGKDQKRKCLKCLKKEK